MQDPVEVPRQRLRRAEAAAYCRRRLGQAVTANTLRSWSIDYKQLGRDAVYEIADLDAFIDQRLKAAPRRRPGPPLDLAAAYENRRRLLVPDAGAEEGALGAFEWTVGEYRRRHVCTIEKAKEAVQAAIAARAKPA